MTVCCYEFFGRRRPAPFCQQTNLVKFSSPRFKLVLQLPAKNFKEIVKIKCDNHKILDNFCQIKNYSEECPCHHNIHLHFLILIDIHFFKDTKSHAHTQTHMNMKRHTNLLLRFTLFKKKTKEINNHKTAQ